MKFMMKTMKKIGIIVPSFKKDEKHRREIFSVTQMIALALDMTWNQKDDEECDITMASFYYWQPRPPAKLARSYIIIIIHARRLSRLGTQYAVMSNTFIIMLALMLQLQSNS